MTRTSSFLRHGLVALAFAIPAALYARLPDPYPTHWGFSGQVDGWTPKPLGPFIVPLAMAFVHGLMLLVERAGRRDEAAIGSRRVLEIVHTATLALLLLTVLVGLRVALGGEVDVTRLLLGSVGVFLAVTGNYLGKLRRNRWIGVRTPWTLASDEIWARTHRASGPLFVVAGLALATSAVVGGARQVLPLVLITIVVAPIAYSYVLARRMGS